MSVGTFRELGSSQCVVGAGESTDDFLLERQHLFALDTIFMRRSPLWRTEEERREETEGKQDKQAEKGREEKGGEQGSNLAIQASEMHNRMIQMAPL
jgi:hypothetical protein